MANINEIHNNISLIRNRIVNVNFLDSQTRNMEIIEKNLNTRLNEDPYEDLIFDDEDYFFNKKQPISFSELRGLYNAEENMDNNEDGIKDIVGKSIYELIKEFAGIDDKRLKWYGNPAPEIEKYYKSIMD